MGHSDHLQPIYRGAEQRASIRVVYETLLMIADWDGASENFPSFSSFVEVKTCDLSATGVGFISPRDPKGEDLLLMFGNPQAKPIFIKARVAYRKSVESPQGPQFRIGCEFRERLTR